jgi:hypothetical protein
MPILTQSAVGGFTVTNSMVNLSRDGILLTGVVLNTPTLAVDQMPNLAFWVMQTTAGAGLITFVPEMASRGDDLAFALEWIPLSAPVAVAAVNVPTLLNFQFPTNFIRLTVPIVGGAQPTIRFVYGAFAC